MLIGGLLMADQLRAGIVGAGFMGEVHARAVRAAGGVVARVAASTPERSAAAAARLGAEGAAESAEALLAADDVDVVHVCTPNALHAPVAEQVLAAGKPVVCEKPLATTVEDARRLDRSGRQALPGRDRAVRVPLLSHRPRGQGPHRGRRGRAAAAAARDLPAGLAVQATGQQLAGRPAAWRRLPCVRRHRRPLVRPDGVRHRPPHHPAQRPHGDRVRPPPRGVGLGRGRHRGCRDGAVRDRRRAPAARW